MGDVFVGSEAVLRGKLSPYQLRAGFRSIYPNIYLAHYSVPSLRQRSEAAWLWSGRRGVLADSLPRRCMARIGSTMTYPSK
jgi:hypothetical protein